MQYNTAVTPSFLIDEKQVVGKSWRRRWGGEGKEERKQLSLGCRPPLITGAECRFYDL